MIPTARRAHDDAVSIWLAGVDAVRGDRLMREHVRVDDTWLSIGPSRFRRDRIGRIAVVGAGKAGAGMAAGLESALGPGLLREKQVSGWVNVPDDCVSDATQRIRLHGARPAGVNEPTEAGVLGAERILEIVGSLGPDDLCICLISGGGSALLPAPIDGVRLSDKQDLTRFLSGAGADIRQLNTVRKRLSRIKGGGLARACTAGNLVALIVSDVIGDPLEFIASGPTVPDTSSAADALEVLERFGARQSGIGENVFRALRAGDDAASEAPSCRTTNLILANNSTAVSAAAAEARRRGYATRTESADVSEGSAEKVGRRLAEETIALLNEGAGRSCLISGGEPVVTLVPPDIRGLGGRNQQLVLAALERFRGEERFCDEDDRPTSPRNVALLSGGTDGEDGPTDAAGAVVDGELIGRVLRQGPRPDDYLGRNDAYRFFEAVGGLLKTGPTHTNVCDVRVVVVD